MAIILASKPGLTGATALSIPTDWDATWFRNFINNVLKGGDVRNAAGANGVSVSGTIASPYATIGLKAPIIVAASASGALMVLGPTPLWGWLPTGGSPQYAIDIGAGGAVRGDSLTTIALDSNMYYNGTNWIYKVSGPAADFNLSGGNLTYYTAPSGAAGTPVPLTSRFAISNTGNTSIVGATQCQLSLTSVASTSYAVTTYLQGASTLGYVGVDGGQALATGSANGDLIIRSGASGVAGTIRLVTAINGGSTQVTIATNGGVVVGAPTGGSKGAGTINCTGLYVNGVAVTVP